LKRREIVIDGSRFDNLDGFFDEIERVLTENLTWRIGRNMDAFNDLLRGGFGIHEYGEPITIKWLYFTKSKYDFSYPATVEYYKKILRRCHPSNIPKLHEKLDYAEKQMGDTLMDIIIEIILDTDNSGHDCTLLTVD